MPIKTKKDLTLIRPFLLALTEAGEFVAFWTQRFLRD